MFCSQKPVSYCLFYTESFVMLAMSCSERAVVRIENDKNVILNCLIVNCNEVIHVYLSLLYVVCVVKAKYKRLIRIAQFHIREIYTHTNWRACTHCQHSQRFQSDVVFEWGKWYTQNNSRWFFPNTGHSPFHSILS